MLYFIDHFLIYYVVNLKNIVYFTGSITVSSFNIELVLLPV